MKIRIFFTVLSALIGTPLFAEPDFIQKCSQKNRSIDHEMRIIMEHELDINIDQIDVNKIKTEIIFAEPVGSPLIEQFAQETYENLDDKAKSTIHDYEQLFSGVQPYNLGLRITYSNQNNQQNVFIASGLIDRHECSVRFNGWLVQKREF